MILWASSGGKALVAGMGAKVIGAAGTIIALTAGLKQQPFLPHGSRGWEDQDESSGRFSAWWGRLAVFSHGGGVRELSAVSYIRALVPFLRALTS